MDEEKEDGKMFGLGIQNIKSPFGLTKCFWRDLDFVAGFGIGRN